MHAFAELALILFIQQVVCLYLLLLFFIFLISSKVICLVFLADNKKWTIKVVDKMSNEFNQSLAYLLKQKKN